MPSTQCYTTLSNGIPETYTEQTSNAHKFLVRKGQVNKYRLRPSILNEHVESSSSIVGTVNSSTIVGQIFKASNDNINGLMLSLESAANTTIDTFETYADNAALQVEWVATDSSDKAVLSTSVVKTGTKSMNLPMSATVLDEWVNTISSTDYNDFTFSFDFYQTKPYNLSNISFYIGDGTNTKSIPLVINDANSWVHFDIDENSMAVTANDATGTTPTISTITKIGFRLNKSSPTTNAYIDNLVATASPGQIELKLWDMGDTMPTASTDALDDGTQYDEIGDRGSGGGTVATSCILNLLGGKKLYTIKTFIAGVALENASNTILTVGNYYAITLHYVDTNISVYGPNASLGYNYYKNGYAFTAPDTSTAITAIGLNSDLMFGVLSTQDVYINKLYRFYDAAPGNNSTELSFIEDKYLTIKNIVEGDQGLQQTYNTDFRDRFLHLPKGGKFEVYHNDDYTDSITQVAIVIRYIYSKKSSNN